LKTRDATDTLEAVTLGRNWYNFLTAGRNSYFPKNFVTLQTGGLVDRGTGLEGGVPFDVSGNKLFYLYE